MTLVYISVPVLLLHVRMTHNVDMLLLSVYYAPAPRVGALSDDERLTSVCHIPRA